MSTNRRFLAIGVALGVLTGVLAGAGGVLGQSSAAPHGVPLLTLPALASPAVGSGSSTGGAAIAYPYPIFGGTPGLAPDHTIVVTSTGQAGMSTDGSDRAAAERTALVVALADAKVQASAIAASVGVSLTGVVSVRASVGAYGPLPLAGSAAPGQTPGQRVPAPMLPEPTWPAQLSVSVTVVYGIG